MEGGATTFRRNALVPVWFCLSVTWIVTFESPMSVGVPVMLPAALRLNPAGKVPAEIVKLYGGIPPLAATELE